VTIIEDIEYNLKGQQVSLRITSTINGEAVYRKLIELETSKEGFRVNLSDLIPQERWRLLKGETITIVVDGEEIVITPIFEEVPVTVYSEIITVREDIIYNDIGQVVTYSDTVTTHGLSAGMILKARDGFEGSIDHIWEMADQAFINVEDLEDAIAETEDPEELARLTAELEEAQGKKERFLELALLVEEIYNNAGTLIEEIENNAPEEVINALHTALFEDIYSLGDMIDAMIIELERENDIAGVEYDRLKLLAQEAKDAADEIRDFASDFADYEVIRLTEMDEQDRVVYQEIEHYIIVNGEVVLNSVEKLTNTYDGEGRLIEARNDLYSIDEDALDESEREVMYSYNLLQYNYEGDLLRSFSNETYDPEDTLLRQDITEYEYDAQDLRTIETRTIYEEVEKEDQDGNPVRELGISYRETTSFSYVDGKKHTAIVNRYVTSYAEDFDGIEELIGTEERTYGYDASGQLIEEHISIYDATGETLIAREEVSYGYDETGNLVTEARNSYVMVDDIEHLVKETTITNSYENEILVEKTEEIVIYEDAARKETQETIETYDPSGSLIRKTTTIDTYSSGNPQQREEVIDEYDGEGRLVNQEHATYEASGGELNTAATERIFRDNFIYDAERIRQLLSFDVEVYELNNLQEEELKRSETITREYVYGLLEAEDLANKAEQRAGSRVFSLEGGIDSYERLQDGIDIFLKSLPLQKDTLAVTLRDETVYDESGRVISYKERIFSDGVATEVIWSVVDKVDDIVNWIGARIESLREKIDLLNIYKQEAAASGNQTYEAKLDKDISDTEAQIAQFEELLPFAQDAKIKIDAFSGLVNAGASEDVLKDAHQEIFDALAPLLEGANEFTWGFEDLLWLAEQDKLYAEEILSERNSAYSAANQLVGQLEEELTEAIEEEYGADEIEAIRTALFEAKENTRILKEEKDLAQEIFDNAEERVEELERAFDLTFDIKARIYSFTAILSSILDVETETQRTITGYNDLGQITGYTDATSQLGLSQINAWRSLNTVITISRHLEHNITFLADRIDTLEAELAEAEAHGDSAKVEELADVIGELTTQKENLESLLPLVSAAEDKAGEFYQLVTSGADKGLIENSQLETLAAIADLGYELDTIVWDTEDRYLLQQEETREAYDAFSTTRSNVYILQEIYNDADKEAKDAEREAAEDPTPENISRAEELREMADIAEQELEDAKEAEESARLEYKREDAVLRIIEKTVIDLGKIQDDKDFSTSVFSLSSIIELETQIQRDAVTYNKLGQITGYIDTTSQLGLSKINAWRTFDAVVTINHRFEHSIAFLADRIELLEDRLAEAQAQGRLTTAEELRSEIDELIAQREALQLLLPLASIAQDKASEFYELVTSGANKGLIEYSQIQTLEAIADLGYELDTIVWGYRG